MSREILCPNCGSEMFFRIDGFNHMDRDRMRDARFCNGCKSVFSTHAHGYSKQYQLTEQYSLQGKALLISLLERCLMVVKRSA